MRIARPLYDEIVSHAREDAPDECCGMVASRDGEAIEVYRARNVADKGARRLRFEIDPKEQLQLQDRMEEAGLNLGAIYHSHTRTEPQPSQTDITYASNFTRMWQAGVVWIIVGLGSGDPEVRAWLIDEDGRVSETELVVE